MDVTNGPNLSFINIGIWILIPIGIYASTSSESWMKNCQQYHESSTFCDDLLKITSRMTNKNSLRNAAFNQATIKQTIETQLPKKNGSERVNLTLKSEEKSLKDSISANKSARKLFRAKFAR